MTHLIELSLAALLLVAGIALPTAVADDSHAADAPAVDWCAEHALPESACTVCNPELEARYRAAGDWCAGHGFPESVCPKCNPQPAPRGAAGDATIESRVVQLATTELEDVAGIRTVVARHGGGADSIACTARIAFDADRLAEVRAAVPGIVRKVTVALGDRVAVGDPLFTLDSVRISELQAAIQSARGRVRAAEANLERQRGLRASAIASARQVELARSELATARSAAHEAESVLAMAGASDMESTGTATVTATVAGTVIRRPAIVGTLATTGTLLATIADTTAMWALCDVAETDAPRVTVGQKAQVSVDGDGSRTLDGEVTWLAAEVDPRTRSVVARIELADRDGRLRANQFARAFIETSAPQHAVAVPRAAVQRIEGREVVFVRTAKGVYEPRIVTRLPTTGVDAQVAFLTGDVNPGDAVVTTGAVLLRTEMLPGSIGAGCCETSPPGAQ